MKTAEEVNAIRWETQSKAVDSIEHNGGRGILAMCTGSGKSRCAIEYVIRNKPLNIALIVPTEDLRDNGWKEEFEKWGIGHLWNSVTKLCYASAHKIKGQTFDLVILDEIHRLTTLGQMFFENNKCKDRIGLTATIPSQKEKQHMLFYSLEMPITFHLTLEEGVELGFISPFDIEVVKVPLNNIDKDVVGGTKKYPKMVTEFERYQELTRRIDNATGKWYKFAVLARVDFIYKLESKLNATRYLLKNVIPEEDRVIIFCGRKEIANKLSSFRHYSGIVGDLQAFKDEDIDEIACIKALNEGQNISNVDTGLINQIQSNELDFIQRLGRLIRWREGHKAKVYVVVAENTKDEEWSMNALRNFNVKDINFKKISDFYENKQENT